MRVSETGYAVPSAPPCVAFPGVRRGPRSWLVPQPGHRGSPPCIVATFCHCRAPGAHPTRRHAGPRARRRRRAHADRAALYGAALRGLGRPDRGRRPGRGPHRAELPPGRRRARRDAARLRRAGGAAPAARRRPRRAGAVPDRQGRRRGPDRRAHRRRRRLRHQAVQPRGGRRPAARPAAPGRAAAVPRRPSSSSAT